MVSQVVHNQCAKFELSILRVNRQCHRHVDGSVHQCHTRSEGVALAAMTTSSWSPWCPRHCTVCTAWPARHRRICRVNECQLVSEVNRRLWSSIHTHIVACRGPKHDCLTGPLLLQVRIFGTCYVWWIIMKSTLVWLMLWCWVCSSSA